MFTGHAQCKPVAVLNCLNMNIPPNGRQLRILLSAYACNPGEGSESAVGWNWAIQLTAMGHEVWVITRENNRDSIELTANGRADLCKLKFIYHDLPPALIWLKKRTGLIYIYYFLWQLTLVAKAKAVVAGSKFDLVHHVTFVTLRVPSFLSSLGLPFIYGPVAGGEVTPIKLIFGLPFRASVREVFRMIANAYVRIDPLARIPISGATRIWVTSKETLHLLPYKHRGIAKVSLAIGVADTDVKNYFEPRGLSGGRGGLKCLFVGRFIALKGMHLGLRAFAILRKFSPASTLTFVGSGPNRADWISLCEELGITDCVKWINWMPRSELHKLYAVHEVLIFPSLRDSGGMVLLESMMHGVVPVCLDLGGPGVIVDETSGHRITAVNRHSNEIVQELAAALISLCDAKAFARLSCGANRRASSLTFRRVVQQIYSDVTNFLPGAVSSVLSGEDRK